MQPLCYSCDDLRDTVAVFESRVSFNAGRDAYGILLRVKLIRIYFDSDKCGYIVKNQKRGYILNLSPDSSYE